MAGDLKQLHRRVLEDVFSKGTIDVLDQVCDPGYRGHDPLAGDMDLHGAKENVAMYRSAFTDLRMTVLGQFTEGDVVVTHWRATGTHDGQLMGISPTGARCTVEGVTIGRTRGGRLLEEWTQWDALGLLRQLGVAPTQERPRWSEGAHPTV